MIIKLFLLFYFLFIINSINSKRLIAVLPTIEDPESEQLLLLPATEAPEYFIDLATEVPEPDDYDYTNWTRGPIPAGIYFRISQKGIDYITNLTAEALPQLLENTVLPTVDQPEIKISKLTIEKFGYPKIKANFIQEKGIGAHIELPQVMVSAIFEIPGFFSSTIGKFKADIQNLTILMEIHISRNETAKHNIIETPICNVTSNRIRIVFVGEMATALNFARSLLERTVIEVLGTQLCDMSNKVAEFFEEQKRQILTTTPVPPSTGPTPAPTFVLPKSGSFGRRQPVTTTTTTTTTTTPEPDENENAIYETSEEDDKEDQKDPINFAADLCANEMLGEPTEATEEKKASESSGAAERLNPLLVEGSWAPDLTLMYAPKFTNQDVVFGLDGGIVYFGQKAKIKRPHTLNISAVGEQMFGLIISEYVPNTFLAHIYNNRLGTIKETIKTQNLPKFIKPLAKLLCSTCELQLIANLTSKPVMVIDSSGVMLKIGMNVAILFVGKKNHTIVNANTKLDVIVKPYLKYSRIYGDVALTSVDIRMKDMGVRGMFANSIGKALNAIVPRKLWPKIKKRLRFALNQRGIKLPVICGLELEKPSMTNIDHAIVINTDFSYNLPRFVEKFKAFIGAETVKGKKKQSKDEDEDY